MPVLSEAELSAALRQLPGWEGRGDAIVKEFTFADFMGSVGFVNRVAEPAEAMNHHPDLAISWNRVTVSLSTHSEGGVTDADIKLARQIDELA